MWITRWKLGISFRKMSKQGKHPSFFGGFSPKKMEKQYWVGQCEAVKRADAREGLFWGTAAAQLPVPDFPCFVSGGSFLAECRHLRGNGHGYRKTGTCNPAAAVPQKNPSRASAPLPNTYLRVNRKNNNCQKIITMVQSRRSGSGNSLFTVFRWENGILVKERGCIHEWRLREVNALL